MVYNQLNVTRLILAFMLATGSICYIMSFTGYVARRVIGHSGKVEWGVASQLYRESPKFLMSVAFFYLAASDASPVVSSHGALVFYGLAYFWGFAHMASGVFQLVGVNRGWWSAEVVLVPGMRKIVPIEDLAADTNRRVRQVQRSLDDQDRATEAAKESTEASGKGDVPQKP